jgi:hypothetical protein
MMFSSVYSAISGQLLHKFTTSCQARERRNQRNNGSFWHDAGSSIAFPKKPPHRRSLDTGKTSSLLTFTNYLLFAETFAGAPFACCLLAMPPRTCPLAAFAAVLAFSAFFLLSAAAFLSLPSLMAAWRAALRASGRWVLLSLITSSEAPTMARWCLTVRRVRFFATSCRKRSREPS